MKKAAFWIVGLLLALLVTAAVVSYSAAAGYARNGGDLDLFSPSTEVDVVGNGNSVVAITGDDNSATVQPPPPARSQEMIVNVLMILLGIALVPAGIIVLLIWRADAERMQHT